jgi:endonuclease/exonuclease/phosphatase family metal-dependent hydrolase
MNHPDHARLRPSLALRMLRRTIAFFRLLRRWVSRREWTVRLLGLEVIDSPPDAPGVVLLQIDGLSRRQLERALQRGKMPFVKKLCKAGDHRLASFYSGLPSTTPAVQAELFFGVRAAVPAFAFRDSQTRQRVEMIQLATAARVEERLGEDNPGLLADGGAYCNIFAGGAAEPHYCAAAMGARQVFGHARRGRVLLVALWNIMVAVRSLGMLVAELVVAVSDFFRGVIQGNDLWAELKLVPARVIVAVLIRELITIGVEADVTRGLPIIHANFLGYDEQSHGRGPSSAMAHWSLRQIDDAIARIVRAARASRRRDYQIWLYSDHGQQASRPFEDVTGRTLEQVVEDLFRQDGQRGDSSGSGRRESRVQGIRAQRAGWLGGFWAKRLQQWTETPAVTDEDARSARPMVVAKGPLGHVYLPSVCEPETQRRLAARLADEAAVPWVFMPREPEGIQAWHGQATYGLPEDAEAVFGAEHPFLPELAADLERVCRHRDAGDLVVSGWHTDGTSVSFVRESGSHAGPGTEETGGFVLIPTEVPMPGERAFAYWRPSRLREAVLQTLRPEKTGAPRPKSTPSDAERVPPTTPAAVGLRLMTYNVHSCVGTDGKLSPARIARMIAAYDPDVVALQEVDVGRSATRLVDQAAVLAGALDMQYTFHPAIVSGSECYGNAILSRVPIRLRAAGLLPVIKGAPRWEPRGVVWVTLETESGPLQVLTTHLGLSRRERRLQVASLLGSEWLGHPQCIEPVVLCGDFNLHSSSPLYRQLTARFRDAQTAVSGHRPRNTWFSHYPMLRLDHVFVSPGLEVRHVQVPATHWARVASDHRPVIVDLELPARCPC